MPEVTAALPAPITKNRASMEALAELQRVLEHAACALACQDEGRMQEAMQVRKPMISCSAVEAGTMLAASRRPFDSARSPPLSLPLAQGYFLARSHVRYAAEALLGPLQEQFPEHPGLSAAAATCSLLDDTFGEAIERLSRSGAFAGTDSSDADATAVLEAGRDRAGGAGLRGVGAGLLEAHGGSVGPTQESRQHPPAPALSFLREVAGSLDAVVGLDAIKQARRSSLCWLPCGCCWLPCGCCCCVGASTANEQAAPTSTRCRSVLGLTHTQRAQGPKRDEAASATAADVSKHSTQLAHLPDGTGLMVPRACSPLQELREAVLLPMRYPQLFTGIRRPQCNLLLWGAPGTGGVGHSAPCRGMEGGRGVAIRDWGGRVVVLGGQHWCGSNVSGLRA